MDERQEIFNIYKPVIGLVHLPAFPGTYSNNGITDVESIILSAIQDASTLAASHIDAMLFCNEYDKPYTKKAEPHIVAFMTKIVEHTIGEVNLPFGIDVQWDPFASLAIAKATQASFIRGLMAGTFCGDLGSYSIDSFALLDYRKKIGAENIKLFTNLSPEFSYSLDQRSLPLRATTAFKSSLVDAVCVSGVMAGKAESLSTIKEIKDTVGDSPIFVNTGVTKENIYQILKIADGCFVASSIKSFFNGANRIDPILVEELMKQKGI